MKLVVISTFIALVSAPLVGVMAQNSDEESEIELETDHKGDVNGPLETLGITENEEIVDWVRLDAFWEEFEAAARKRFATLTGEDWSTVNDDHERLVDLLQERNGWGERDAKQAIRELQEEL